MCEPVSMTMLAAGVAGGTSLIGAGALTGTAITGGMMASAAASAGLAGISTYMGMAGADQAQRSGMYAASGSFLSANEMMKQIKQIEDQAMVEEMMRREEFEYVSRQNLAAVSVTGARIDSETWAAIQERNENKYREDQAVADLNEANAKGQAAGQGMQHNMAGFAQIVEGENRASDMRFQTLVGLAENFPTAAFGRIGGGGITNPSKTLMANVQRAVS